MFRSAAVVALATAALPALGKQASMLPPDALPRYVRAREALVRTVAFARSRPEIFGERKALLGLDEKRVALDTWTQLLDAIEALEPLRRALGGPLESTRKGRKAELALGRAAFYAAYRHALDFIALADADPMLAKVIDEPVVELGQPGGTWSAFRFHWLNVARATEFTALEAFANDTAPPADLAKQVEEDRARIWEMGKGKGQSLTVKNAAKVIGSAGFAAWFPIQKKFSTWAGDTRVRRGDTALIGPDLIAKLPGKLRPGDVLLERREWFLSNLGLPGFWTHAALYVGTADERRQLAADPEVQAWARSEGQADGDLEGLLQARFPDAARASGQPDVAGHPPRVLEAMSDGVVFTTIEHSAAADSLAALRPYVSNRDRAVAILRAFRYAGRAYDFDFDLTTDSALVCSELIYKAYEPGENAAGVRFDVEKIAGRDMVSPNGVVKQFDQESSMHKAQWGFVLFLDGSEKQGRAREASLEAFRASWRRPKWHIITAK